MLLILFPSNRGGVLSQNHFSKKQRNEFCSHTYFLVYYVPVTKKLHKEK